MDSEQFSSLVSKIYDAALDRTVWPAALEQCCRYVGGSAGNLFFYTNVKQAKGVNFSWGNDPHFQRLYNQSYTKMNPLYPATTFYEPGTVISQSDIITREEMTQTRFYKEWLEPQGIVDVIFGILQKSSVDAGVVAVRRYRNDGFVDAGTRHRMELVLPHLRRSILIGSTLDFKQSTSDVLAETLNGLSSGVFLVTGNASIVFSNAHAQRILEDKTVLRNSHNMLAAVNGKANQALRAAFAAAESGDAAIGISGIAIPLTAATGENWIAHILPLTSGARQQTGGIASATAALFIRKASIENAGALETVFKLYQLTAGELRVLKAVMDASGVPAIADELGVSEATVRTHLRNLFQKTGTNRQAQLVKLVAGAASPISA